MIDEKREYIMIYHEVLKDCKLPMSDEELIEHLVYKCYDLNLALDYLLGKIKKINNEISEFKYCKETEIEIDNHNFDDLPF